MHSSVDSEEGKQFSTKPRMGCAVGLSTGDPGIPGIFNSSLKMEPKNPGQLHKRHG